MYQFGAAGLVAAGSLLGLFEYLPAFLQFLCQGPGCRCCPLSTAITKHTVQIKACTENIDEYEPIENVGLATLAEVL